MLENIDSLLENQSLKKEFEIRSLDLSQVFYLTPDNLERENIVLRNLLDWVQKYSQCRDRKKMEAEGYEFSPIEPGISPENDWYLFERWINDLPIRQKLKDWLPQYFFPQQSERLNSQEIYYELNKLIEHLNSINISVDLNENIPYCLQYNYLLEYLDEEYDIIIDGSWHLDGCTGYCPDCIQRPWCETGNKSCWPEDEEAGEINLPESVKKYVSSSPMSLQILKTIQAAEDSNIR